MTDEAKLAQKGVRAAIMTGDWGKIKKLFGALDLNKASEAVADGVETLSSGKLVKPQGKWEDVALEMQKEDNDHAQDPNGFAFGFTHGAGDKYL